MSPRCARPCRDSRLPDRSRRPGNPPDNPKATFQAGKTFQTNKDSTVDAQQWLQSANTAQGSWWPDFAAWLAERCGALTPAPTELGGGGLRPLAEAPGTYVYEN